MINLGSILLKTRKTLIDIKKALILSGESFKPPLRHFSQKKIDDMFINSDFNDDIEQNEKISYFSLKLSSEFNIQLKNILHEFNRNILDLQNSFISLEGGYLISHILNRDLDLDLDNQATMSYSLFTTAAKCAWLLKKMQLKSILLECNEYFQFIHKLGNGIFSSTIKKGRQNLGLLRLIIPRYCKKLSNLLDNSIQKDEMANPFKIESLFTELSL